MSDQFQSTTYTSWFSRIKNSLVGIVAGLIFLVLLPMLLFWNEGRAVQTAKSLKEGAAAVVSVDAGTVAPTNDGKLIHVTAPLTTTETLVDTATDISARGVHLERVVEMFQWNESCESRTQKELGGGERTVTTCNYTPGWHEGRNKSENFKQPQGHANPQPAMSSQKFSLKEAKLGAFTATPAILNRLGTSEDVTISEPAFWNARAKLPRGHTAVLRNNRIVLSASPDTPRIGDLRISYKLAPLGTISVVGRQNQSQIARYQTQAGDALLLVTRGAQAAAAMFKKAEEQNALLTWILRLVGVVGLFIAFLLILEPIGVLADVVPAIGGLVRFGTGTVAGIAAILVGGLVIGIAWLWYRPLIGLAVIAVAVGLAYLLSRRGRARSAAQGPVQAA